MKNIGSEIDRFLEEKQVEKKTHIFLNKAEPVLKKSIDMGCRALDELEEEEVDLGKGVTVPTENAKRGIRDLYEAQEGILGKVSKICSIVSVVLCILILGAVAL